MNARSSGSPIHPRRPGPATEEPERPGPATEEPERPRPATKQPARPGPAADARTPGVLLGVLDTIGPAVVLGGYRIPASEQRCAIEGVDLATDGTAGVREYWMVPGGLYYMAWYRTDLCWMLAGDGLDVERMHRLTRGDSYATVLPLDTGVREHLDPGRNYALWPVGVCWELRRWP
ncbi:hypothetical protein Lfu02_25130 [Longispora fulva]|uniref:Uncharacterized protein n=1 Tax=Longispora fulva TaxID=619741 RepID=A0A8J7KMS2_9ACTN|nr:hypothetical protein [Longispora fulva]MBG6139476.1 hypothetical protein [Longispora fulva]GIG58141.1 hypothetical protein Lfu02_25130 [Longispora fulva]